MQDSIGETFSLSAIKARYHPIRGDALLCIGERHLASADQPVKFVLEPSFSASTGHGIVEDFVEFVEAPTRARTEQKPIQTLTTPRPRVNQMHYRNGKA